MTHTLIAFTGAYGSGKTTTSKRLHSFLNDCGIPSKWLSLGNLVRDNIPNVPKKLLYEKPTRTEVRNLIKGWGETKKIYHPDRELVWAKMLPEPSPDYKFYILDDLRFAYDYDYLYDLWKGNLYLVYLGDLCEQYDLDYLYHKADLHV